MGTSLPATGTRALALVVWLAALAGSGCGTRLFFADFELDTVGAAPSASPAGDPAGDSIDVGLPADATVAVSPGGGRALSFNIRNPGYVAFRAIPTDTSGTSVWAYWIGSADIDPASLTPVFLRLGQTPRQGVTVAFRGVRDPQGGRVIQVEVVDRPGVFVPFATLAPGARHGVVIQVRKSDWHYLVDIIGDSSSSTGWRPLPDPTAFQPLTSSGLIELNLNLGCSRGGLGTYLIDDVVISKSCPDQDGWPVACSP
jgi:hypothetical protein